MPDLRSNKSFWGLVVTQFLGAFNDNAFRQFILLLALMPAVKEAVQENYSWFGGDIQPVAMGLFSLPFVLFALLGGAMADRFSKRNIIVAMKWAELGIMIAGLVAFLFWLSNPSLSLIMAMAVLCLMGTQSAFFGPSKYGTIPEIVDDSQMTRANGVIMATTWVSIILGTLLAGWVNDFLVQRDLDAFHGSYVFIAIALVGLAASLLIKKLPAAAPGRKLPLNLAAVIPHAIGEIRYLSRDRDLLLATLGVAFFSLCGAVAMQAFNKYGQEVLGYTTTAGSSIMWAVAVGIGLGSLLAARLSGGRVEFGIVPLGAVGMSCGFGALYFVPDNYWVVCGSLIFAGLFGGLYVVPLNTFVQHRPSRDEKGRVLGVAELLGFLFIFMAAGVYYVLVNVIELDARQVMLALGILSLVGSLGICAFSPQYLIRAIFWVLTHSIYRIRRLDPQHVPVRGGALLVSNHVSYADPFLIGSSIPRLVRFLMHRGFQTVPFIGWFGNRMQAIPIAGTDKPRELVASLQRAADHAAEGHLVCIFAEGGITRTGNLLPFSKGLERIARRANVPIIPVYIDRMWGSIFSFHGGKFFFKRPLSLPYPVTVSFGEPLPPDAPAYQVRAAVQQLSATAFDRRKKRGETLATRFVRVARRFARSPAAYDHTRTELSYRKLLIGALILRDLLRNRTRGQSHVGVLLPSSNGGALTNVSLALMGKVSVNLNFTAGQQSFDSAVEQCQLQTIITSRQFLEKLGMQPNERHVFLEELMPQAGGSSKLKGLALSWLPAGLSIRLLGLDRNPDADATVIFSSGSTGEPKGVCLTHHNILSNVRSVAQVFDVNRDDRIVGVLPFFHSFGYTVAIWFPFLSGIMALYHVSPIDAKAVARLIREHKGTLFMSTPTFYQSYLRRFSPEDFATVRIAASGAEKLKKSLNEAWQEKFGAGILEGYGCTELSPVVSLNLPDVRLEGIEQVGGKFGTIGHPLPGVAARVVNPETMEELGSDEEGLLLIKGPNVMRGYLNRPDLTHEVIRDGWYVTGDVACIDSDGFVTITDRLSRFSKIGGEMVPHVKIEEAVQAAIQFHDGVPDDTDCEDGAEAAVTSVPDDAKGERLIVLHTKLPCPTDTIIEHLRGAELPNLWIPRKDAFVEVEAIPKLGSGKLDLRRIRELATEYVS